MKGKVAIVTASSTGIGKAIIQRLASEGCHVVVSSRSKQNVDEVVSELRKKGYSAIGIVCHVGKQSDLVNLIKGTIQHFGKLNYLVCNAAVSTHMGSLFQANQKEIRKMWETNFLSTLMLVKQALPELKKQKNSAIVINSSYTGYQGSSVIGHYGLTKSTLIALTKAMAKQLYREGVRVNGVAPGLIKTKFSGVLWKGHEQNAEEAMQVERLGVPEDIAGVVNFLLSDDSSYIFGQTIAACGRPIARF